MAFTPVFENPLQILDSLSTVDVDVDLMIADSLICVATRDEDSRMFKLAVIEWKTGKHLVSESVRSVSFVPVNSFLSIVLSRCSWWE
jgi:hypothetical protein